MRIKLSPWLRCLLASGMAFAFAPAGAATTYSFSQGGFDEGASISGTFTVDDVNSSGDIRVADGSIFPGFDFTEITAFSLSFSGNSLVPAFSQTLADLDFLVYKTGTPSLGDDIAPIQEGISTNVLGNNGQFDYYSGMAFGGWGGTVTDNVTAELSSSDELVQVQVAAVPVPGAVWLFGSALSGLLATRRRKKPLTA